MKKLVCMVFAFLISAFVSSAQDIPRGDIAAGVSDLYIIKGYTINMVGPSGAFTANANNWLGVVGDFGVYFGHIPQSFSGELYTFGPRFYLRKPGSRFVPFGQVLFGGSHFSTSTGGISGGGTQFAFGLGGGGDLTIHRGGRFAVRGQVEYFGVRANGGTTPCSRLSAGLVYRLGKRRAGGS